MGSIEYSDEALNVRSRFYNSDNIVYVEGEEDILFWETIFNKIKLLKVKVEEVGGAPALDEIINKIDAGDLDVIAARDSDYKRILGEAIEHDNVIYTYGYSIENTLYTAEAIRRITRIWCRGENITSEECQKWFDGFIDSIESLVHYDLANYMHKTSYQVLGNNCSRFMKNIKSPEVDVDKVKLHLKGVSKKITKAKLSDSVKLLEHSVFNVTDIVRGHFLTSAILKYINSVIKALRKPVSVPYEALYASIIQTFESTFNEKHPHYDHYATSLNSCIKTA